MIGELQSVSRALTVSAGLALLNPITREPPVSDQFLLDHGDSASQAGLRARGDSSNGPAPLTVPLRFVQEAGLQVSAAPCARSTRAARMAAVWARIQSYGKLGSDWAGLNAVAPSPSTIRHARLLLDALHPEVDVPLVAASGDGEVVFTWLVNGDRIEAAIEEDGFLSWATRISGKVSPGGSIDLAIEPLDVFQGVLASHFA